MTAFKVWVVGAFLIPIHLLVLLAGFFAPFGYAEQHRAFPYCPPSLPHLMLQKGGLAALFYPWRATSVGSYEEDRSRPVRLQFLVRRSRYAVLAGWSEGPQSDLRLFGFDSSEPIFLLGSDAYGRDQFSRLLYGGECSLFTGLLAAFIALGLGTFLGATATLQRWLDEAVMRATEISMSIPAIYLLLAVRAALPLRTGPQEFYTWIALIIGATGWARPARLVRGVVLSVKSRDYVAAARGFGATEYYLFRCHILPELSVLLLTQMAVLIPQYVLAEVTLSFLGLGVNEPVPSWGNMLVPLQQYAVLANCPWMFAPALAAIPVAFAYYVLSIVPGEPEAALR